MKRRSFLGTARQASIGIGKQRIGLNKTIYISKSIGILSIRKDYLQMNNQLLRRQANCSLSFIWVIVYFKLMEQLQTKS